MNSDPKYTLITLYDALGYTCLFEIEDTPLDTQLKVTIDESGSLSTSVGILLFVVASLLPESTAKWHAWKSYQTLLRDRLSMEARMTGALKSDENDLPF